MNNVNCTPTSFCQTLIGKITNKLQLKKPQTTRPDTGKTTKGKSESEFRDMWYPHVSLTSHESKQ
jgi:hypothetical protein